MRSTWQLTMTFAALAIICGCQEKRSAYTKQADDQAAMARVHAAQQMSDLNERDAALATACRSAAKTGAGQAVHTAIPNIANADLRDQVAEESALKLRDAGEGAVANRIAGLITSQSKRDEVLKKLATAP